MRSRVHLPAEDRQARSRLMQLLARGEAVLQASLAAHGPPLRQARLPLPARPKARLAVPGRARGPPPQDDLRPTRDGEDRARLGRECSGSRSTSEGFAVLGDSLLGARFRAPPRKMLGRRLPTALPLKAPALPAFFLPALPPPILSCGTAAVRNRWWFRHGNSGKM